MTNDNVRSISEEDITVAKVSETYKPFIEKTSRKTVIKVNTENSNQYNDMGNWILQTFYQAGKLNY